ncbi:organic solute transporter Ostalpha-domain-containing protein [Phaeosphaeria sp. MPI-PUGE-AT-0046c]|nr:organic solute transporter Ostalpha-domain-containing protein [Phaeosphaeria sp. MPI-PUGE-AT-0046c]
MSTTLLAVRGLFNDKNNDSNSTSKHVCPSEDTSGPDIVNLVGNLTYHEIATIVSGACGVLSFIIIGALVGTHAFNYSNPVQQRQTIRIALLVPWVSLFSFLIVWLDGVGEYLELSLDFGCAIALSAFLLFMCDLVLSHPGGFDDLFGAGAQTTPAARDKKSPMSIKRTWYGVLQFIPTSMILWIATAASLAAGTYCKSSNNIHFAHIWITVLKIIFPTIAILACLKFHKQHKEKLQQHKILLKLFAFKGIIGLNVLQTFIISILASHDVLEPSKYMTYHDIDIGLASLILACEMPLFAILIFVAFSAKPYSKNGPAAGPLSAIVDAFNITDLLSAFVRGPMRLVRDQQRQILRQASMKVGMEAHMSDDEEQRYQGAQMHTRV